MSEAMGKLGGGSGNWLGTILHRMKAVLHFNTGGCFVENSGCHTLTSFQINLQEKLEMIMIKKKIGVFVNLLGITCFGG